MNKKYKVAGMKEVSYKGTKEFKLNSKNRVVNPAHQARLEKLMEEEGGCESWPPILVNAKTMNVIDGQHRLWAFQRLIYESRIDPESTISVKFIDIEDSEAEIDKIQGCNINTKNWTQNDFISGYAKEDKNYSRLENWCKSKPLLFSKKKNGQIACKYRYGAAMITGKACSNDLKHGNFSFTEEEFNRANDVYGDIQEIIDILEIKKTGPWLEGMAISWIKHKNLHTFVEWKKEFKRQKRNLGKMAKNNASDWDAIFALVNTGIQRNANAA